MDAYWEGIREIMRPAFDEPSQFAVQKGIGVVVLHSLLPEVLELVRDKGLSPSEPESYSAMLEDALTGLQGENGQGSVVDGIDFWVAGVLGAAGTYSSSSGQRVLIAKIRGRLPNLNVD